VTLSKNGNVLRIFRNGDPVATITNAPLVDIKNNKMYLGYNFIGIMDDVAIYSSPLTQAEIQNQVNQLSLRILFFLFYLYSFNALFISFLFPFLFFFYFAFFLFSYLMNFEKKTLLATGSCGGCLNGGICGKIQGGKQCFCSQCFSGNLCEIEINGCENPCKNGGINIDDTCQCAAGFKGPTCSSCIFFFFFFFFFLSFLRTN